MTGSHSSLNQMMTESPGNSPIKGSATSEDSYVMSGAVASTTPPKSMREMLGLKDAISQNSTDDADDAQHREKTAYVELLNTHGNPIS